MHTRTEYVNTYHIMYLCTFFPVFYSLSPGRFCFHSFYLKAHGRIEIPNQFCATRNIPTMSFVGLNLRPLAIKSCGNSKKPCYSQPQHDLTTVQGTQSSWYRTGGSETKPVNLFNWGETKGVKQKWKKSEKGRRFRHQTYTLVDAGVKVWCLF